ncbi:hypothetical protein ACU8V1_29850 (plasmid) [Rhizobium leguminosarum]|uniref:Uncharacterized protein n=1 Tax=Rhizobium leguminosarum TaxID=384 RepID=A0A7M3DN80_RHILE|nr:MULTISPECIES: hypothetical protein [Rhizobium]MBY5527139.1 hypothetical protein [Rhizobium leguminosarum]MCJ9690618.1 hypothetical protein [Rhizobium sp. PRIMUS64]MDV4165016.1 hypothetical protein [Rhizobium leguminosarum]MDV4175616.1 hypothetical protein [Rhizobium leguminosarum]NKJ92007.1 hypothetical protein [Rhizobium leguminosarum bv. viciae]
MGRERGRRKLMLRLPDFRRVLADRASETLDEIFEAYDLAADALDRFRRQSPREEVLIKEYEQLCREIEQEVIMYCTDR